MKTGTCAVEEAFEGFLRHGDRGTAKSLGGLSDITKGC